MNNHKNYIYDYLGWDKEKAPFSGAKRMEPEIRIELTTRCLRIRSVFNNPFKIALSKF